MIEREREADLARRAGLADRETLGEVVQADAGRDQQREPLPGDRPATHDRSNSAADAAPGPSSALRARFDIQRS